MKTWREWRAHGGSVILPKRASSPSTKAGGVPAAPWRSSWSAPHPNPLPESAGLSGESKAVARSRSCATREDPRGRTWSGHPRLRCGDSGWLKTWMPGTSPGKGLLQAKFGVKRPPELPLNFPRTALPPASEGSEALVDRTDTPSFGHGEPGRGPSGIAFQRWRAGRRRRYRRRRLSLRRTFRRLIAYDRAALVAYPIRKADIVHPDVVKPGAHCRGGAQCRSAAAFAMGYDVIARAEADPLQHGAQSRRRTNHAILEQIGMRQMSGTREMPAASPVAHVLSGELGARAGVEHMRVAV